VKGERVGEKRRSKSEGGRTILGRGVLGFEKKETQPRKISDT